MLTIANTMDDNFADRLRVLRAKSGWSLRQLGAKAGMSGAYISQLETGARGRPNIGLVQKLAAAFGMTVSEFMQENEPRVAPLDMYGDTWQEQLIRTYAPNIPLDEARSLLELLNKLDSTGIAATKSMLIELSRSSKTKKRRLNEGHAEYDAGNEADEG